MLYISRHVGLDGFGVVDTDDGTEEFIDRVGIVRADELGVRINGVSHTTDGRIGYITPYQLESFCSVTQTKFKLLNHVDIRTHNGAITFICWDSSRIVKPVTIRLSDFGTRVEDCIFAENPCSYGQKATIIVDNKIEDVSEFAFRMDEYGWSVEMSGLGDSGLGVVFDLRELTNWDLTEKIYEQLDAYGGDSFQRILNSDIVTQLMRERLGRFVDID